MLARAKTTMRWMVAAGAVVLGLTFWLLVRASAPVDPIATMSQWSHWEVVAWFQEHNLWMPTEFQPETETVPVVVNTPVAEAATDTDELLAASELGDGVTSSSSSSASSSAKKSKKSKAKQQQQVQRVIRPGLDGAGLTQLSLTDLIQAYGGPDGDVKMATRAYHALQKDLLPPNPYWWLTPGSLLSLIAQTAGIFSILMCCAGCAGLCHVKRKVEQSPMGKMATAMLGLQAPPQQSGAGGGGTDTPGGGAAGGNGVPTSGAPPDMSELMKAMGMPMGPGMGMGAAGGLPLFPPMLFPPGMFPPGMMPPDGRAVGGAAARRRAMPTARIAADASWTPEVD